MAQNRIFDIFEWKMLSGTISSPDYEFVKLYSQQEDGYWYSQDNSTRKRISWSNNFGPGFFSVDSATSSIHGTEVSLKIGSGLTFSTVDPNVVEVKGITVSAFEIDSTPLVFTVGQVLSAASSSGKLEFVDIPSVSGTVDRISKFSAASTLGDSRITEGATTLDLDFNYPVISLSGTYKYSLKGGKVVLDDKLYLEDDANVYLEGTSTDFDINTGQNFKVKQTSGYNAIEFVDDVTNLSKTFSILNELVSFGHTESNRASLFAPYLNNVTIGSTDSSTYSTISTFNLFSSSSKPLRIVDGTEGLNKFFISDSNGYGSWQNLGAGSGLALTSLTFSIGLSGYGLSFSGDNNKRLFLDYSIFDLSSFTYSSSTVSVGPTVGLSTTGVTSGTYGSATAIPSFYVGQDGRITSVSTFAFTASGGNYLNSPYDKNWRTLYVNRDGMTASTYSVSYTPVVGSYVSVYINGQEFDVGNGTTFSSCYFGTNSNLPKGFSSSNSIVSGDYLYWNPSVSGFNLDSNFRISLHYLYNP